jgi:ketosteroid isomerase-like protein
MERLLGALLIVTLGAGGTSTMALDQAASTPDDRAALARLNDDYVRAVFTSDTARFEQILAADFRNTNADGTIVDRPAFIAQIAKPSNLESLTCDDVEIRIFGDTAIIHARTVYVMSDGRPGTGRYTDIWHKQDGRWLAVAAHVTRLVR